MNAHAPTRTFAASDALQARSNQMLPLLVGLAGPSGSGKTFSALRIATGIQSVVGGDIFVIDTEQRRALHYSDSFKFKHVPFEAPFASLDYLEALRFAKKQGAGVVVIDSCSHEHDGPGGLLEQHEAELQRMAGNDYRKRDAMTMLAWQKPKAGRRKLIAALTSELDLPAIFCFRAKTTTKPIKDENGRAKPVDMGFTTIGADEWMFEMALSCLLLPGSNGCPTWASDKPGEKLAIKVPRQFRHLAKPPPRPLDENVGAMLAKWAKGEGGKPAQRPASATERFVAHDAPTATPAADDSTGGNPNAGADAGAAPQDSQVDEWAEWAMGAIAGIARSDRETLAKWQAKRAPQLAELQAADPKLHGDVMQAIIDRNAALDDEA
jgi:ABC-type oligopeptide transport system ATPase subunit